MRKNLLVTALLVVMVGAGSFFGGMKYQQSKRLSSSDIQTFRQMRDLQGVRRMEGPGMIRGEIINKDESSITVKLPDNSSKIVLISENTTINKTTDGSVDDLKTGEQIMVFGQANSDGSVSATTVQIGTGFGPIK